MAKPLPKVILLPARIFSLFKTGAMACVNITTFTATSTQVRFPLLLFGKLKHRRALTGAKANSTLATAIAMHFPANAGLIFLRTS
jgi:hypothetical protein